MANAEVVVSGAQATSILTDLGIGSNTYAGR
jgi:hypothetical protein